jgi:hypothetical protein
MWCSIWSWSVSSGLAGAPRPRSIILEMPGKRRKSSPAAVRATPAAQLVRAAPPGVSFSVVLPYLAIVAVTILAYLPAIGGGMLWDDDAHITKPALQSLHGLWAHLVRHRRD